MPLRIVVTGSECTGKTTLSQQLADRLGGLWLPEYSRRYVESVQRALTAADVEPIARGQMALEDASLLSRPQLIVQDTDLVSTVVYAEFYYGRCPPWIEEQAQLRLAPLYLICDIDIPWIPDGVRDQPNAREMIHARFVHTLERVGARAVLVSGLGPERLEHALTVVRDAIGLVHRARV